MGFDPPLDPQAVGRMRTVTQALIDWVDTLTDDIRADEVTPSQALQDFTDRLRALIQAAGGQPDTTVVDSRPREVAGDTEEPEEEPAPEEPPDAEEEAEAERPEDPDQEEDEEAGEDQEEEEGGIDWDNLPGGGSMSDDDSQAIHKLVEDYAAAEIAYNYDALPSFYIADDRPNLERISQSDKNLYQAVASVADLLETRITGSRQELLDLFNRWIRPTELRELRGAGPDLAAGVSGTGSRLRFVREDGVWRMSMPLREEVVENYTRFIDQKAYRINFLKGRIADEKIDPKQGLFEAKVFLRDLLIRFGISEEDEADEDDGG
jgi:hypothetical protein